MRARIFLTVGVLTLVAYIACAAFAAPVAWAPLVFAPLAVNVIYLIWRRPRG